MPKYKTRNSFMSYEVYLKKRETTCHYNKGLYWIDPSGGHNTQNAIHSFKKAICADPHNEDAKYQLQILKKSCPLTIDCSGCQWLNAQQS